MANELGRVPTFEDVLNHPKMPHPNTYSFYFGSFAKAIERVEGKIRFKKWQESNAATKPKKARGGKPMARKSLTDNQILKLLHDKSIELGRYPSIKEINSDPELPSYATILQRIGSKRQIQKIIERELTINSSESKPKDELTNEKEQAANAIMEVLGENAIPESNRMVIKLDDFDGTKTINLVVTLKISLSK